MELLFFSPDEKRAQRVSLRLRHLATVQWEDSRDFSPERWAQQPNGEHLILLDYNPDCAEISSQLAHQLATLTPEVPLLGVGSTHADRAVGVLAALRAGVRDFIDIDDGDNEIRVLLDHALQRLRSVQATPASTPHGRGQSIVVLGARPGVGASTLAAHLGALAIPAPENGSTPTTSPQALLLDLGRPGGDAALYLGVAGNFHYADALHNAARIDSTFVRTALAHHASQLAVLSQPGDAAVAPGAGGESDLLVDRLLGIFDLLLCDASGLPYQAVPPALLRTADEIWLVADQSIGSMVSLDIRLHELEQLGARDPRLSLVINRHDAECGIHPDQIAERFALPLLATLPERSRALRASANQGLLLHQIAPRDPYIRALAPMLCRFRISTPRPVTTSRWRNLLLHARGFR